MCKTNSNQMRKNGLSCSGHLTQCTENVPIVDVAKFHFMIEAEGLFLKMSEFVIPVGKKEEV